MRDRSMRDSHGGVQLEQLPYAAALLGEALQIVRLNAEFRELAGLDAGDLLPAGVHPEDRDRVGAFLESASDAVREFSFRLLHEDGRLVWVSCRFRVIADPDGILLMMTDVTMNRQSEEILSLYTARLETVQQIIGGILECRTVQELGERVLHNLMKIIPYDCGCIVLFDDRGGISELMHDGGFLQCPRGELEAFLQQLPQSSRLQLFPAERERPVSFPVPDVQRMAAVPLIFMDRRIGLLLTGSRMFHFFGGYQLDVLQETGEILAVGLHRLNLLKALDFESQKNIRLLQEVNHRVKNNLSAIMGMLYESRRHLGQGVHPAVDGFIRDMISRVHGMSILHQELSASQWRPVPVAVLLKNVVSAVLQQRFGSRYRLELQLSGVTAGLTAPPDRAHTLGLILTELATNAGKHALPETVPELLVTVESTGKSLRILFRDNGPGFPAEVLKKQKYSTGLSLVQGLVLSGLQGSCRLYNDSGAAVELVLPETVEAGETDEQ